MFQRGTMLFLFQELSSCARVGEGVWFDQVIQRDLTTDWPIHPAARLRGTLHQAAEVWAESDPEIEPLIKLIFGTPDRRGSLTVFDAQLLAFPVPLLGRGMAWITCPRAIKGFQQGWRMIDGLDHQALIATFDPTQPGHHEATSADAARVVTVKEDENKAVIADMMLTLSGDEKSTNAFAAFASELAATALHQVHGSDLIRDVFTNRLLLVNDSIFSDMIRNNVSIQARVVLDSSSRNGIAVPSYEEVWPAHTLFYAPLLVDPSTSGGTRGISTDTEVIDWITGTLLPNGQLIQIGSAGSTGRIFATTRFAPAHLPIDDRKRDMNPDDQ